MNFSFICSHFLFFLSTLKDNTKIWSYIYTGGEEKTYLQVSLLLFFQFGNINFFSDFVKVVAILLFVNCAPVPEIVPHSLNEQKCIGESSEGR